MRKTVKQLVEQAYTEVVTIPLAQAIAAHPNPEIILVDIRDIRELTREGTIPGAVHAPRGMLEFWFDAESQYHREVFAQADKTYVFYCAGAWRSALAAKTLQDMGIENVAHLEGGFGAWKKQGGQVEEKKTRK